MVTWALPCQNNAPLRLWTPSPWRMLSLNEPTKWMAFVVTSSPCPVRTPRLSVPLYDAADLGRWGQLTCPTPCGTPSCTGPVYTPPLARSTASPFIAYFPTHQLCHDNKPSQQQEQQEQQEQRELSARSSVKKKRFPMNQGIKCPSQMSALLVGCSTAPHRWEQTRHREGVCLCWLFVGWMPVLAISRAVALSCHLFVLSHPAFPQTKNTFECLRGPEEESARKNKESNEPQHNVHFPQLLTSLTQATACSHGFVDICDPCAGLGSGHKHPSRLCCK